jgi:hypothetical protein
MQEMTFGRSGSGLDRATGDPAAGFCSAVTLIVGQDPRQARTSADLVTRADPVPEANPVGGREPPRPARPERRPVGVAQSLLAAAGATSLTAMVLTTEQEWFAAGPAPQVLAATAQAAVVAAVIAGLQHRAPLPLRHWMLTPSHRGLRSAAGPVAAAHPSRSAPATASAGPGAAAHPSDLKVAGRRWSG